MALGVSRFHSPTQAWLGHVESKRGYKVFGAEVDDADRSRFGDTARIGAGFGVFGVMGNISASEGSSTDEERKHDSEHHVSLEFSRVGSYM